MRLHEPASAPSALTGNSPTHNRGRTPEDFYPGTLAFAIGTAGGRRTYAPLPLPTLLGQGRGGGCRHLVLQPRHHGRGATTVSRGSRRGPSLGRTSRRYPRNLQWMQRPVNKSVGQSRAHLVQGRVEQRRREKARRRGKVSTTKRATTLAGAVDRTLSRRESQRDSTRLPRAVTPWPSRNPRALDPECIISSKLPSTSSVRRSLKLPQADNHQDVTSHTPENRVSKEETRE